FIGAGDSEQRIEDSEVLPIVVIPGFVAIPQGPTARHIPAWAAGPGLRPSQNRGLKARYIVHKLLPPETRRWSRREFMCRAFSPLNVACPGPRPAAYAGISSGLWPLDMWRGELFPTHIV